MRAPWRWLYVPVLLVTLSAIASYYAVRGDIASYFAFGSEYTSRSYWW